MDGFETTERIRNGKGFCRKDIPIVVLTADCTCESKNRILRFGINDFMTKPIKSDKLYSRIKNNLCNTQVGLTLRDISKSA
jgi:CheY-like chemotaxis protein